MWFDRSRVKRPRQREEERVGGGGGGSAAAPSPPRRSQQQQQRRQRGGDSDTDDDRGCVAYGLALNAQSGSPDAAAKGLGDKEKISRCEPIVGEPRGGGIPVP